MTKTDWAAVADQATAAISAMAPLIDTLIPGASEGILLAERLAQGVIVAEPTAVALFNQVIGGTPISAAQMQTYSQNFDTGDDKLRDDIQARIDALPPA